MDDLENLERLHHLREKKIINDLEFDGIKKSIIDKHLGVHLGSKSGVAYAVLAWLLGIFGAHNFYAGYTKRAIAQILITLFSGLLLFVPILFVQIWALGDLCLIDKDAENVPFYGDKALIRIIRIAAVALFVLMYFLGFLGIFSVTVVSPNVISM